MPKNQHSSFSWRHGGHSNGRRSLPVQRIPLLRQMLSWSRGAPAAPRRWEVKYGIAQPPPVRQVECKTCGSSLTTLRRVQGGYICAGCMRRSERRAKSLRPQQSPTGAAL